jgi:hypothetical protein
MPLFVVERNMPEVRGLSDDDLKRRCQGPHKVLPNARRMVALFGSARTAARTFRGASSSSTRRIPAPLSAVLLCGTARSAEENGRASLPGKSRGSISAKVKEPASVNTLAG